MSGWVIEAIRMDGHGLRVDFVRHSPFVGVEPERVAGLFTRWIDSPTLLGRSPK